jgi:hypothetical protein
MASSKPGSSAKIPAISFHHGNCLPLDVPSSALSLASSASKIATLCSSSTAATGIPLSRLRAFSYSSHEDYAGQLHDRAVAAICSWNARAEAEKGAMRGIANVSTWLQYGFYRTNLFPTGAAMEARIESKDTIAIPNTRPSSRITNHDPDAASSDRPILAAAARRRIAVHVLSALSFRPIPAAPRYLIAMSFWAAMSDCDACPFGFVGGVRLWPR